MRHIYNSSLTSLFVNYFIDVNSGSIPINWCLFSLCVICSFFFACLVIFLIGGQTLQMLEVAGFILLVFLLIILIFVFVYKT